MKGTVRGECKRDWRKGRKLESKPTVHLTELGANSVPSDPGPKPFP